MMMMTSSVTLSCRTSLLRVLYQCSSTTTWAVRQLLLIVWLHILMWWMPSSKLIQHYQVVSRGTSVQRSWTDPAVRQALQAVRQTFRCVCVSERLSKSVNCEYCAQHAQQPFWNTIWCLCL